MFREQIPRTANSRHQSPGESPFGKFPFQNLCRLIPKGLAAFPVHRFIPDDGKGLIMWHHVEKYRVAIIRAIHVEPVEFSGSPFVDCASPQPPTRNKHTHLARAALFRLAHRGQHGRLIDLVEKLRSVHITIFHWLPHHRTHHPRLKNHRRRTHHPR